MNRRSFMKAVGGVLAGGVVALPSKAVGKKRSDIRPGAPATQKDFQDALTQAVKEKLTSQTWVASEEDLEALRKGDCSYIKIPRKVY